MAVVLERSISASNFAAGAMNKRQIVLIGTIGAMLFGSGLSQVDMSLNTFFSCCCL